MDHTSFRDHSNGLLKKGTGFGTYPSGIAGYWGVVLSFQVLPPFLERCIFTPKWPWFSVARRSPFRGSAIMTVTLSPTKAAFLMVHREVPLATVKSPFLVEM